MFLHCLQPIWPVFEPKKMIWKFTSFDLWRPFWRSSWPHIFILSTYLESSHQDASYCMVKCLKKPIWKFAPGVTIWAAHISKTVKKSFSATSASDISMLHSIHMQNFRKKSRSISEKSRKIDFWPRFWPWPRFRKRCPDPPSLVHMLLIDIWVEFQLLLVMKKKCCQTKNNNKNN